MASVRVISAAPAMALFTVSDHVITGEATPSDERQSTFNEMVKIALESVKA